MVSQGKNLNGLIWSIHQYDCPSASEVTINSMWPSDAIWRQRSGSTLAQVMASYLTAPSHYLNQCWLIISPVTFILGQFHERCLNHQSLKSVDPSKICLKITCLKFHSNFPGANELIKDMGKINCYLTTKKHNKVQNVGLILGMCHYTESKPGLSNQKVKFIWKTKCFFTHTRLKILGSYRTQYVPFDIINDDVNLKLSRLKYLK